MTMSNDVYEGEALPLTEHLREFRTRLIIALTAVLVGTVVCLPFAGRALQILISPLTEEPLALGPTTTIVQWIKVGLVGGIALAMPVVLYELVAFLLPALTKRERRYLFFFLPLGTLFFILGVLFGAFIVLPYALAFLQSFGEEFAHIQYQLEEYISFVTTMLVALGAAFQTPLVIFFLAKMGIVDYAFLKKNMRWAFLISAVLSAIVTPADPWTMLIVLGPLFLLYLLGVLFARFA